MNDTREQRRRDLLEIYHAGLAAVGGERAVGRALADRPEEGPVHVVAIGKAAAAMMTGALKALDGRLVSGLVITKEGHLNPALENEPRLRCLESSHPIPDRRSLDAGAALLAYIGDLAGDDRVLFLISGGASSLVEVLAEGVQEGEWFRLNEYLLSQPLDIGQVNAVRKAVSAIKGGRLARLVAPRSSRVLMISDVPGDDPAVIGSGLMVPTGEGAPSATGLPDWIVRLCDESSAPPNAGDACFEHVDWEIIATNAIAREAAARKAEALGYPVLRSDGVLTGEVSAAAREVARELMDDGKGIRIWGGETTVTLPEAPGRGGRCQSLALTAAVMFDGLSDLYLLAAGTDGTDGPTADAGAVVDWETVRRGTGPDLDPERCLEQADAGRFLEASEDLIHTGPTGTNVTDLVVGLNDGPAHGKR